MIFYQKLVAQKKLIYNTKNYQNNLKSVKYFN